MIVPYYKNHTEQVHTICDKIQNLVISEQLAHTLTVGFRMLKLASYFVVHQVI